MKNLILRSFLVPAVLVILSSCSITSKITPQAPVSVQVELEMEDLEYIGMAEGTATQKYILGIPYGGRARTFGTASLQSGFPIPGIARTRGMNNAMYDALSTVPDADFVLPVSTVTKRDVGFLGSTVTLTVKAKAFKIKETN